ncbi:hypothetical protein BOTBODRAFT_169512 [Botryobasidium botryosum FD-172 SS1]|uniref:Uncharacterized protein n=1 Tax=Botryobasidium botryosum (strain FD-172 SS1) TaxID=930990 RepID=A0A067MYW3_BOTB1|nr:hypothetical protein BOTBODRAFT_169512 [Botryobasidium botryosum FD-172 SS1]
MNSPSSSPSTPSSGSPPPDESSIRAAFDIPSYPSTGDRSWFPHAGQGGGSGGGSSKRRVPPGGPSFPRDGKSRRREDQPRRLAGFDGRQAKDEFVDGELRDRILKVVGDPFDESLITQAS